MAEKLRLATRYLSARHSTTLNILLALTRNNPTAYWDHTDNPKAADAILVDTDSPEGQLLVTKLDAEKNYVVIAHGESSGTLPDGVLFLPKPLVSTNLLPILEQAARLHLKISHSDPSAVVNASASPDRSASADAASPRRIIDLLVSKSESILAIASASPTQYAVIFDKKRRCYYQDGSIIDVPSVLLGAVSSYRRVDEMPRERLEGAIKNLIVADLDPVLWKAGLTASNGALYGNLPESGYYKLRYWPDLKKLGFNIVHMKVASVLRQGGAIFSIANMTQVPTEEVINFINVCYFLSYLEPVAGGPTSARSASTPEKSERDLEVAQQKRGLFSRIRSRLGL